MSNEYECPIKRSTDVNAIRDAISCDYPDRIAELEAELAAAREDNMRLLAELNKEHLPETAKSWEDLFNQQVDREALLKRTQADLAAQKAATERAVDKAVELQMEHEITWGEMARTKAQIRAAIKAHIEKGGE